MRLEQLDREAREPLPPLGECSRRDRSEIAGDHQRAPDLPDRKLRRLRDGFGHQPFNGTLAQLAQHGTKQKILFVLCGAGKQFADQARPTGRRAGAARLRDAAERGVDLCERQLRGLCRIRRHGGVQRCRAEPDTPLPRFAREKRNSRLDLIRLEAPQTGCKVPDLVGTGARAAHTPGRRDDVVKLHGTELRYSESQARSPR